MTMYWRQLLSVEIQGALSWEAHKNAVIGKIENFLKRVKLIYSYFPL